MKPLDKKDLPQVSGGELSPDPWVGGELLPPVIAPSPTYPQFPGTGETVEL